MSSVRWKMGTLVAVMAAGLVGLSGTAGAHGPEATFTPISQEPVVGELAVKLRVTLIYDNDAEPVDDATVQVMPVDPTGGPSAQATLTRAPEPGTYEGTVPVPAAGEWTFKLTSADPEAEFELAVAVPETAPATTATPTTNAAPTSTTAKDPPVASSLPDGSATTVADTEIVAGDATPAEDVDEGSFPWGIAVLVAVVAAGVAMAMAYALRSRPDDAEDEGVDDGGSGPGSSDVTPDAPASDG